MPTSLSVFQYIWEQLSSLQEMDYRAMMGEYLLYYRGKVVGGVYDDRLLVKPTPQAKQLLPHAAMQLPYPGGKPMLTVGEVDDGELLRRLVQAVASDLPATKKR